MGAGQPGVRRSTFGSHSLFAAVTSAAADAITTIAPANHVTAEAKVPLRWRSRLRAAGSCRTAQTARDDAGGDQPTPPTTTTVTTPKGIPSINENESNEPSRAQPTR